MLLRFEVIDQNNDGDDPTLRVWVVYCLGCLTMFYIIEITRYLTLNETINACSMIILPLFRQTRTKVHVVDPSNRFLAVISQHLDPNQMTSVRLPGNVSSAEKRFLILSYFHSTIKRGSVLLVFRGPSQ